MIVGIATGFETHRGACGTGHYLLTRLIGGLIASGVDAVHPLHDGQMIVLLVSIVVNITLFALPLVILRLFVAGNRYVVTLFLWTVLFLSSYFFFFPTAVCP